MSEYLKHPVPHDDAVADGQAKVIYQSKDGRERKVFPAPGGTCLRRSDKAFRKSGARLIQKIYEEVRSQVPDYGCWAD